MPTTPVPMPTLRPLSPRLPPDQWWREVSSVLDGAGPVHPVPSTPVPLPRDDDSLLPGAAVALATSGSTGAPKIVVLDAPALLASATATLGRLGGPGQWLQTLSPAQVAGWQVWVRSVLADRPPVVLDRSRPFAAPAFVQASSRMRRTGRRYVALVPTQVHRLLTDPAGRAALQGFDAVLVGGAALAEGQRRELDRLGVNVVTTYGGTETSGGCLYEGRPLTGVGADVDEQGRLLITGPMLARGYLGDAAGSRASFVPRSGRRWFLSADLGEQGPDGTWQILGRADDVISTGAHKVHPSLVEDALSAHPAIARSAVLGAPDPEWGQRVVALVVLDPRAAPSELLAVRADPTGALRGSLRHRLPDAALPREVHLVTALPLLDGGKVDRATALRRLPGAGGTMGCSDDNDT